MDLCQKCGLFHPLNMGEFVKFKQCALGNSKEAKEVNLILHTKLRHVSEEDERSLFRSSLATNIYL